jgi:hypothetical protein
MSKTHEVIDWQGISLSVDYSPNSFGTGVHHIEIRVLQPEGALIPVTDSGYRSHFFSEAVEHFGGPGGYVLAWLDHHAASPEWKRREAEARQLRLF